MEELRSRLEHFRKDHDEILRFLHEFEAALTLAGSEDPERRCAGLARLREMEQKLAELRAHCREEEESVDSPFAIYLEEHALEHLKAEHDVLEQFTDAYRDELRYLTTPPPATDLVRMGQRLLAQLRHHIAYEEGLLKQIEDGNAAEEKVFLKYTHGAE